MKTETIDYNGFEPYSNPTTPDGVKWLYAHYAAGDEIWRTWPKFVSYDGDLYRWSCFNSDDLYVVYKQAAPLDLAVPVITK